MATRDPYPRFSNYEIEDAPPYSPAHPGKVLPGLAEASNESSSKGVFEKHWLQTLAHVLTDEVHELRSAEILLLDALPVLALATADQLLRAICEIQIDQTQEHLRRLDQVLEILGLLPDNRTSLTMEGLLVGVREIIAENKPSRARDHGLVCAVHQIKEFEVTGYCSARDFAQLLGIEVVVRILQKTLDEEASMKARLANVAELLSPKNSGPSHQ